MTENLGKFVWNKETDKFTIKEGCFETEDNIQDIKDKLFSCIVDCGFLVNTDISGETKLRRIVLTYDSFEFVAAWSGTDLYVLKRSL